MNPEATGRCHCSAVRYVISGEPISCHACHCTDCQAQSGSAFTISVLLQSGQLSLLAGAVETKEFLLNNNTVNSHACAACGSTLWLSSPAYPDIVALKGGTLDDKGKLVPVAHLWMSSAQPWVVLPPGVKVYQEQPTLEELLALVSRG